MEVGRWWQWDSHWGSWRWASAACGEGSCGGRPGDLAQTSMVLSPSHVTCGHWSGLRARKTLSAHRPLNSILLHRESTMADGRVKMKPNGGSVQSLTPPTAKISGATSTARTRTHRRVLQLSLGTSVSTEPPTLNVVAVARVTPISHVHVHGNQH